MRTASLMAALSEEHPYSSLICLIASLSSGSSRIVVAFACSFLITEVYLLDNKMSMCYTMSVVKLTDRGQQTSTLGLRGFQACGGDVRHPSP